MSTILDVLSQDFFTYKMIPMLTAIETRRLSLVSKEALKIVKEAASAFYNDITLEGTEVQENFKGDLRAFFHYKVKMIFLKNHPEIQAKFKEVAKELTEKKEAVNIEALVNASEVNRDTRLFLSLICFDFTSKKIEADGERGIGKALQIAEWHSCMMNDEQLPIRDGIQIVLSHPNALKIEIGRYSVVDTLTEAIKGTHLPHVTVRAILSSPVASNIPKASLVKLLSIAKEKQKPEIEKVLSEYLDKARPPKEKEV